MATAAPVGGGRGWACATRLVTGAACGARGAAGGHVACSRLVPRRQEESLNFAVECMQSDLAHAKQQLAGLKAQVGM
jgi:hypothetical protein